MSALLSLPLPICAASSSPFVPLEMLAYPLSCLTSLTTFAPLLASPGVTAFFPNLRSLNLSACQLPRQLDPWQIPGNQLEMLSQDYAAVLHQLQGQGQGGAAAVPAVGQAGMGPGVNAGPQGPQVQPFAAHNAFAGAADAEAALGQIAQGLWFLPGLGLQGQAQGQEQGQGQGQGVQGEGHGWQLVGAWPHHHAGQAGVDAWEGNQELGHGGGGGGAGVDDVWEVGDQAGEIPGQAEPAAGVVGDGHGNGGEGALEVGGAMHGGGGQEGEEMDGAAVGAGQNLLGLLQQQLLQPQQLQQGDAVMAASGAEAHDEGEEEPQQQQQQGDAAMAAADAEVGAPPGQAGEVGENQLDPEVELAEATLDALLGAAFVHCHQPAPALPPAVATTAAESARWRSARPPPLPLTPRPPPWLAQLPLLPHLRHVSLQMCESLGTADSRRLIAGLPPHLESLVLRPGPSCPRC